MESKVKWTQQQCKKNFLEQMDFGLEFDVLMWKVSSLMLWNLSKKAFVQLTYVNTQGYSQRMRPGAYSGICPGGAYIFFSFQGGAQHLLGPENPLKSIDFTDPGGG